MTDKTSKKPSKRHIHVGWVAAFTATAVMAYGAAHLVDHVKENKETGYQFGPTAGLAGKFNRQMFLYECDRCVGVRDLTISPDTPSQQKVSETILLMQKSSLGKLLTGHAINKNIYINDDKDEMKGQCSANASFSLSKGLVSYRAREFLDAPSVTIVRILAHEMYHAFQYTYDDNAAMLNHAGFSIKEKTILSLTKEAAAFTVGVMTVHQLKRQGIAFSQEEEVTGLDLFTRDFDDARRAGASEEKAEIVAAQAMMERFLMSEKNRTLRQAYIFKYNPSLVDFAMEPKYLTMAALKSMTLLPDGRNIMPEDMPLTRLDLVVREDMYNEFTQWKPLGIEKGSDDKERVRISKSTRKQNQDIVCQRRFGPDNS